MDVGQLFLPSSSQINFGLIAVGMDVPPGGETGTFGSPLPTKQTTIIIALALFAGIMWLRKRTETIREQNIL